MHTPESAHQPHTVLIVDDSADNLTLMSGLLGDLYTVRVSNNGEAALRLAQAHTPPDIILLDIMMPEMDGHEVCRRLKQDPQTAGIPVIFLTAKTAAEDETLGFELGAVDYISKPICPPILLARIKAQLQIKATADCLQSQALYLEQEVLRRTQEVAAIQELTILTLASLAESSSHETPNHLRRTRIFVKALAEKLRFNPRFVSFLSDYNINRLFWVAPLHDIGKVGIPEAILRKQGRLTADEFEVIKTHSALGWQAMQDAEKRLGIQADFLAIAKDVTLHHHEKWDGSGYPAGLAGEDIPVAARLMAVADVYDALVSWRPYREQISHADALRIMRDGKGKHFDPDILDAFVENHEEFQMIAERYADSAADLRTPAAHQIRQAPSSETMHGPTGLRGVQAEP